MIEFEIETKEKIEMKFKTLAELKVKAVELANLKSKFKSIGNLTLNNDTILEIGSPSYTRSVYTFNYHPHEVRELVQREVEYLMERISEIEEMFAVHKIKI